MTCTNESWEITIQTGCKLPAQRSTHDAPGDRGPSHSPCLCLSSGTGDDGGVFLVRGEPPSQPPSTASWDSSFWLLRSQNTSHWLKSLLFPRSPLFWGEGGVPSGASAAFIRSRLQQNAFRERREVGWPGQCQKSPITRSSARGGRCCLVYGP